MCKEDIYQNEKQGEKSEYDGNFEPSVLSKYNRNIPHQRPTLSNKSKLVDPKLTR